MGALLAGQILPQLTSPSRCGNWAMSPAGCDTGGQAGAGLTQLG